MSASRIVPTIAPSRLRPIGAVGGVVLSLALGAVACQGGGGVPRQGYGEIVAEIPPDTKSTPKTSQVPETAPPASEPTSLAPERETPPPQPKVAEPPVNQSPEHPVEPKVDAKRDIKEEARPADPVAVKPATPDAPNTTPSASPELVPRRFQSSRFHTTVTAPWIEAKGNYQGDFGALLSLIPEGTADGRAIDIYREAVPVPTEIVAAATESYWKAFTSKLGGGFTVEVTGTAMVGSRTVSMATARATSQEARVQRIMLWVAEDGMYTFVLSTRTSNLEVDELVLRECLANLTFGDLEAVRAAARASLPYSYGRPKGWLLTISGQRALLRAPLAADANGKILPIQSSISITTIGKANTTPESQATFARDLAIELTPPNDEKQVRENAAPKPAWGQAGGLVTATLELVPPMDKLAEGEHRKVTIIFGQRHTFVVTLNSSTAAKATAEAELATFLSQFSESAPR